MCVPKLHSSLVTACSQWPLRLKELVPIKRTTHGLCYSWGYKNFQCWFLWQLFIFQVFQLWKLSWHLWWKMSWITIIRVYFQHWRLFQIQSDSGQKNSKRREKKSRWNSTSYLFTRQYPFALVCGSGFVYSLMGPQISIQGWWINGGRKGVD